MEVIIPENLTTWIFEEGSFVPQAKLINGKSYSIITDHLGTPIQAYDEEGEKVWSCELDIYGKVRKFTGDKTFIPFRFQGQIEDEETDLYYNRFRYYCPGMGTYIRQDPLGLESGEANLYAYVHDPNAWVDPLGLNSVPEECAQSIINNVGPLTGKKKSDIQQILQSQGFSKRTSRNGGEIWTKAGKDGNTASIRLDPAKTRNNPRGFADEVPHAHKEIVPTSSVSNGNYGQPRVSGSQSYNDAGNLSNDRRATHIPIIE